MIYKNVSRKIPEGKLIKIEIGLEERKIVYVKITGDFFLFPEETIIEIEKVITESHLPIQIIELTRKIKDVLTSNKAQIIGANETHIAQLIEEATR